MSSISWQQYIVFLLVITILYYLVIWFIFFRTAVPSLIHFQKFFFRSKHAEDQPDEALSTAQHVIDELRPLFMKGYGRDELFSVLSSALTKYSGWNEAGFRAVINEFIVEECSSKCSIYPSEDELRRVWFG